MRNVIKLVALTLAFSAPIAYAADNAANTGAAAKPAPAAQEYKFKAPKLKRAEVDALLAKPDEVLIIDVRRPDEQSSIGGFPVYLSIQSKDLLNRLAYIPKDRLIITVSNHAQRAGAAADLLVGHEFRVAGAVGVEDYQAEGGTIVKIAPPAPKAADASKQ